MYAVIQFSDARTSTTDPRQLAIRDQDAAEVTVFIDSVAHADDLIAAAQQVRARLASEQEGEAA